MAVSRNGIHSWESPSVKELLKQQHIAAENQTLPRRAFVQVLLACGLLAFMHRDGVTGWLYAQIGLPCGPSCVDAPHDERLYYACVAAAGVLLLSAADAVRRVLFATVKEPLLTDKQRRLLGLPPSTARRDAASASSASSATSASASSAAAVASSSSSTAHGIRSQSVPSTPTANKSGNGDTIASWTPLSAIMSPESVLGSPSSPNGVSSINTPGSGMAAASASATAMMSASPGIVGVSPMSGHVSSRRRPEPSSALYPENGSISGPVQLSRYFEDLESERRHCRSPNDHQGSSSPALSHYNNNNNNNINNSTSTSSLLGRAQRFFASSPSSSSFAASPRGSDGGGPSPTSRSPRSTSSLSSSLLSMVMPVQRYNVAPPSAVAAGKRSGLSRNANALESDMVLKELGIAAQIDEWSERCRKWLARNIFKGYMECVAVTNRKLDECGLAHLRLTADSAPTVVALQSQLRGPFQSIEQSHAVQTLYETLLPYVQVSGGGGGFSTAGYVFQRISELSEDHGLSAFKWDGGGRWHGKRWHTDLPSDAQLLVHVFCTFMDGLLLDDPRAPSRRAFSSCHFVVDLADHHQHETNSSSSSSSGSGVRHSSDTVRHRTLMGSSTIMGGGGSLSTATTTGASVLSTSITSPEALEVCLVQTRLHPPHFRVVDRSHVFEVICGPHNVFRALVVFLHRVRTGESHGMLGAIHLGATGIDLLSIVE